jgi:hypothetical protein
MGGASKYNEAATAQAASTARMMIGSQTKECSRYASIFTGVMVELFVVMVISVLPQIKNDIAAIESL